MRQTSGYEKAVLLELRIARVAAWTLFLAWLGLIVWLILGAPFGLWTGILVDAIVFLAAMWSGTCEIRAEKQLKSIWEAGHLERMVG